MAEPNVEPPAEAPVETRASAHARRNAILVLVGLVVAGLLLWYFVTHRPPPTETEGAQQAATVGTARAELADVPVWLTAIGTIQSLVTATVRSQLAGVLFDIYFREGQLVEKNQVIAQIDPRPYQAALAQAEGALARDQALLVQARIDLKRYQTLLKQDSIASQQVDTQSATVREFEGVVAADQAAVTAARVNLAYTSITAPVPGVMGLRQVDIGNYVTPADTTGIVVINQTEPIDVNFALPQDQLPGVKSRLRQLAGEPLTVTVRDPTGSKVISTGSFLTFDNQIDVTTGTVRAKARFENQDGRLFPNQFVNVWLLLDTLKQAVTVPITAVRHGAQGDFVFLLSADQKAQLRRVQTGPSDSGRIVILSGVQAGDIVITEGADRLADGTPVVLPAQHPPGGAPAQGRGQQGGPQGPRAP
jgi:membrane fusion protein, multidrug efflux system